MRIRINCTGGGSHSMLLLDRTTVLDVKQHIAEREGVAAAQQLLLFAGRQLGPNSARLLEELQLDSYSLAHEVVVYMQQLLAEPVRVFLCQPGPGPCKLHPEILEGSSKLTNIMALLSRRHLACMPFPTAAAAAAAPTASAAGLSAAVGAGCQSEQGRGAAQHAAGISSSCGILPSCVVVKREDGSCCSKVRVTEDCSIAGLKAEIAAAEGAKDVCLTFYQGPDGCLHAVYGPGSADPCTVSHTVYSRSSMPQPAMLVTNEAAGCSTRVPYATLVKQLAVVP